MNQSSAAVAGASHSGTALLFSVLLLGLPGCADSPRNAQVSLGRLASHSARDGQPAVSPDGSQITFVSNRGGTWQVWLAELPAGFDSDSGGADEPAAADVRRLTDMPGAVGRPVFEPDGRHILFYAGQDEEWTVYRVPVPDVLPDPVAFAPLESAYSDYRPDPSMDGRWIVFDRWGASGPPNHDIHLLDRTSGSVQQLTADPAYDSDARISPDGSMILFHSDRDGGEPYELQVYIMNRDGSGLSRLTDGPDRHGYPAWCPDGRHVVFTAESGNDPDHTESRIEVMDLETRTSSVVVSGGGKHSSPVVSPDGGWIVFSSDRFEEGAEDLATAAISVCGRAAQTSR